MGNTTSQYAFARLPHIAIRNVLLHMNLNCLIKLSFCSKRALAHVRFLKLDIHLTFDISSNISLNIHRNYSLSMELIFNFENAQEWVEGSELINLNRFDSILYRLTGPVENQKEKWLERFELSLKDYITHVSNVFNISTIREIYIRRGGERLDYGSLRKIFRRFQITHLIFDEMPVIFCDRFVSVFEQAEEFALYEIPHVPMKSLSKVIIRNLEYFVFPPCCHVSLQLEDLMIINIRTVFLMNVTISDKVINRFIKLWMAGCNLKVENLMIKVEDEEAEDERVLDANVILNGVKYRDVREQEERQKMIRIGGGFRRYINRKGYVIQRSTDFVEATIELNMEPPMLFEFIVWN